MRTESRELLAVGIFGTKSNLGDRIEFLLRRGRTFSTRASGIGIIASTAALAALMLAGSLAPRWIAFAQAQPRPSFEVASIKPGDPDSRQFGFSIQPGRYIVTNATLKMMIGEAFDVRDFQISGGPKWLGSDRFTIEAKPKDATPIPAGAAGVNRLRPMLQSLLEERFKLALHRETRLEQVYELRAAKGGPKLKESAGPDSNGTEGIFGRGRGDLKATDAPIAMLANILSQRLARSVIDKTHLSGKYDFALDYTPDPGEGAAFGPLPADALRPADPNGPSIFTVLQEQLGLRLESTKGPVEVLVIDHAEKPDAN
jgi:uncharacterized protein (TIGR03435 family)